MSETSGAASSHKSGSLAAAFRHPVFAVLWTATLVSNVGTWMYSAASGWLMTSLNPDPLIVALVQTATTLPVFLFALPAGALADIFDKRKFLIVFEIVNTALCAAYAAVVGFGLATPHNLLLFTFLIGAAGALTLPAWQSIVPQLVPKEDLTSAVAANSVGVNISRALGPALGGAAIASLGIVSPFWINAISNLGVLAALLWWRRPNSSRSALPAERVGGAIEAGLRYVRHSPALRATMVRAATFFLFASTYWALLPLLARQQIASGPELYGLLLGAIGAGAVCGAFVMPWLRTRLGPNLLVTSGMVGTAVTLALYGLAHDAITALVASLLAGVSWISVLATLAISAQVALPDWVRAGARPVHDRVLRLPDDWQHGLGQGRCSSWIAGCPFYRRDWAPRCDTFDLVLETASWNWRRPGAVHALAGADYLLQHPAGSWPGPGHSRISYSPAGSARVFASP